MRRLLLLCVSLATLAAWTTGCEPEKEEEAEGLVSVTVGPGATIEIGETGQLTVTGTLADDTTDDVTDIANFTTATSAVATVSDAGLVTGVGVGTVTITASVGFRTGSTLITVVPTAAFTETEPNDDYVDGNDLGPLDTFAGACSDVDPFDVYTAAMNSGTMSVSLTYTEGAADVPDIDLFLYDSNIDLIAFDDTATTDLDDSPAEVSAILASNMTVYIEVFCYLSTSATPYFGTVTRP